MCPTEVHGVPHEADAGDDRGAAITFNRKTLALGLAGKEGGAHVQLELR